MAFNPFATRKVREPIGYTEPVPDYPAPNHGAYAAPSLESGDAHTKNQGWAPNIGGPASATGTPSAQRLGTVPVRSAIPSAGEAPEGFYRRDDADRNARHSVETQHANGWEISKGVAPGDKRWADNPRRTPPPEPRPTSRMAPRSYSFTRPFDQGPRRQLTGQHFSMATHTRTYDILGMAPARSARNTYRIEPTPWDANIVDLPPDVDDSPNGRIQSVELSASPNRTHRLV